MSAPTDVPAPTAYPTKFTALPPDTHKALVLKLSEEIWSHIPEDQREAFVRNQGGMASSEEARVQQVSELTAMLVTGFLRAALGLVTTDSLIRTPAAESKYVELSVVGAEFAAVFVEGTDRLMCLGNVLGGAMVQGAPCTVLEGTHPLLTALKQMTPPSEAKKAG